MTAYPEQVLVSHEHAASSSHLCGHMNWHLGQIDYLRRALTGNGAVKLAGLYI